MPTRFRLLARAAVLAILALATVWFLSSPAGPGQAGSVSGDPVQPYLRLAASRDAATGTVNITGATLVETAVPGPQRSATNRARCLRCRRGS